MKFTFLYLSFILFLSACQTSEKKVLPQTILDDPSSEKRTQEQLQQKNQQAEPKTYTLGFVGDVIIHERLRKREDRRQEGYKSIWSELQNYLDKADLTYVNLEGPVAPDVGPPSGFPRFNFPEKLIPALKEGGFDVVSIANNHSLDKGAKGVRNTIENLKKYELSYTGTISSQQAIVKKKETWWHISQLGSKKIAWLACTEMTNGIRDKDNLVLYCFKDIEKVKNLVQELRSRSDISAIILLPHWGEEEEFDVEGYRKRWAHSMLNLGATAVVGSHPHVVQKIENFTTMDGRPALISYSLGNFVSNQYWLWTKASMLLYLKLKDEPSSGKLVVADGKYIPLWMDRTIEKDGTAKFRVKPVFDLKQVPYEAAEIWLQQLGNERRLKGLLDVENFLNGK